ncbi:DUF1330 domain-containing protein [Colwellia sp. 12G3]|uniref:DUF1330 domain-containing protein n=1 Tax=Colwellia sp. 12G3 TaxID=2058299 RepID=UPI000C32B643|nr:DUF1330 domain-containing protein [Colwellia sp. 12G3]PKI15964.1 DUF1330 domain-containing protein [Colwellia sp. 12G3]
MSYEILVGLHVLDDYTYEKYRIAMKPILSDYQGYFCYDFKVSDVLISQALTPDSHCDINRVFTLNFISKEKMDNFFSDPQYLLVKEEFFVKSVGSATILASYEKK